MGKNSLAKKELMAKIKDLEAQLDKSQAELVSVRNASFAGELTSLAPLSENEELFRLIAMSTPDHILIQDKDLRYEWVINPQLGLTVENMIGKTDFEILPGEDAVQLTKVKRKVMETGVPEFVSVPLTSTSGEIEYIEGSYLPRRNDEGQIDGIVGYFHNITQRKETEKKLAQSLTNLDFLSKTALHFLESMTQQEAFAYIAEQIHQLAGEAIIIVNEYDSEQNCIIVRALLGPPAEVNCLKKMFGRDPVGLALHFPSETMQRMKWGELAYVEGGLQDLAFGQLPLDLCRSVEKEVGLGDIFAMPFSTGQDFLGTVAVLTHGCGEPENSSAIAAFVVQAGIALRRINLERELRQAHAELEQRVQQRTEQLGKANDDLIAMSVAERGQRQLAETLAESAQALSESLNIGTVLTTLLDYLSLLVPFDCANVMMLETDTRLIIRAGRGYELWLSPEQLAAISFDVQDHPILHRIFDSCRSKLIDDTQGFPGWKILPETQFVRNWLGVPLIAGGKVIGVCSLDKTEPGFFTADHVRLAELMVRQAAVAVQNAWLFEQVKAGRERLKSLSQRQVEVQEAERRYVAFELHDEAGQALTSLKFGLAQLEQETDPIARFNRISILKKTTDTVMEDLHRLAMDLRPASLDHLGMVAAIRQYAQMVGERYDLRVQFMARGFENGRLKQEIETTVYRIAQEALTNVIRHARATLIDVLIERRQECMVLIVEDNGIGFEPGEAAYARTGRLGLAGMQERAEMLSGTLAIESSPGKGTTIVVEIPLNNY